MAGWRWLAAALVSIALAFLAALTLAGVALADGDEQEAAAPAALQPTQVVAEIPDGYGRLFPLQWGGGSLYQLKARLGTMGCLANTIWNYDGGEWHGYNQYHVPSTLNAGWLGAYEEFVPAGSLYATCFGICEFKHFDDQQPADKPCLSPATLLEREDVRSSWYKYPLDESPTCTDDFDPLVKQSTLPSMPLYPDTCLIRQEYPLFGGNATFPFVPWNGIMYPYYPNMLIIRGPLGSENPAYRTIFRSNELHELCHANQFFHIAEQMQPDRLLKPFADVSYSDNGDVAGWLVTEPGRAFVDLVGFVRDADWEWSLPDDTYENVYGTKNPLELAAELCSFYFLDRMGEQSSDIFRDPDFDLARYLTPEIVEWIERWVALPEIVAPETG